ncbi:universal stress protein [Halobellus rufus]|uniref:universal stress protein n=1 Tax=Halobellus rufus TaxID=1448860 RepID=UPI0006785FAD|nr:universal stress protein [Halobellus rufus]
MESIAVVVDSDSPSEQLLDAAKRHIAGTDLEVVVCRIVDRDEYQSEVRRKAESKERFDSIEAVEAEATAEAEAVASASFEGVAHTAVGRVGTIPEDVLDIATEMNSTHVFVGGKKRSPAGKMLFGDDAQKLVLDFDGPVTIVTDE